MALAAALAAASVVLGLGSALAQSGGIGLRPAHIDEADPATRAYFKPTIAPGGTFRDQVIVSNTSDVAVDLIVSGVDGLTGQTGGTVYANRQDPVRKAGAWLVPAAAALTVGPHVEQPMGFTVRVPSGAQPGDHLAGIAFENAHPKTSGGNFAITEIVRAVMGVQIKVPGPAEFHMHLDDVGLEALPGTGVASAVVTMGDDGLKLGKPSLSVELTGPGGYHRSVDRGVDTMLPGDTIAYPLAWPDPLKPGDYTVRATITGAGPSVTRTGGASLKSALAGVSPQPVVASQAPPQSKPSGSRFPSWLLIVVAIGGIGGGIAIGRRGRSGRPPRPPDLVPEPPPASPEAPSQLRVEQ
jgi:hypothetical protein